MRTHDKRGQAPIALVVDDDASIRELVGELLESEGYAVERAEDGQQALEHMRASPGAMVVLLDVLMPVLNGVRTLETVVADLTLHRRLGFVIMTASSVSDYEGLPLLIQEFNAPVLTKPFSIDALLAATSAVAARLRP
jgi:CheY-like chemotaxis protein